MESIAGVDFTQTSNAVGYFEGWEAAVAVSFSQRSEDRSRGFGGGLSRRPENWATRFVFRIPSKPRRLRTRGLKSDKVDAVVVQFNLT